MTQKIESFCQLQTNIGLHQVLLFSQAMEPTKKIEFCVAENEKHTIEGFCIIHKKFPIIYIQDGPIVSNNEHLSIIISAIKKHYSRRLFAFSTIQLPFSNKQISVDVYNNPCISKVFDLPTWSTIIINTSNIETLLKSFSKGHLSAIKKAKKEGITTSDFFSDDTIKSFVNIFDANYKTRGLATQWANTMTYFTHLSATMAFNNSFFIGAYKNDKLVAGGIFLAHGNTIHYKFGTSNYELRSIPLMHTVIYQAILKAKELNFSIFDLGGINPDAIDGSQVRSINTFKKGFGGTIITSPKRIYLTNNPLSLTIVLLLLKIKHLIHK